MFPWKIQSLISLVEFPCRVTIFCIFPDFHSKQQNFNGREGEHKRFKRVTPPACPCINDINSSTDASSSILYNQRCYAVFNYPSLLYTDAEIRCKRNATPHAGRLATFDNGEDYRQVLSWLSLPLTGSGTSFGWIGFNNGQWNDPNNPSCPPAPPANLTVFMINATLDTTIPTTGTIGIGPAYTWNTISTSIDIYLCEFGKLRNFTICSYFNKFLYQSLTHHRVFILQGALIF